jgi:glycine/D-amino acid oxidase-like deaminating enzyme
VDREIVETWAEMGSPGATETAQVHPHHFTTSIAELARGAGVQFKTNSKVTRLKSSPTGVEGVEYVDRKDNTTNEIHEVTDIVVAAGPWTGVVLPQAKVEGLRAHSVVYEAEVSPYAVFTDIELPSNYIPEHRAKMSQKRKHKGRVDPEIYARPFGEVYACGRYPPRRIVFGHLLNGYIGEPDTAIPLPETADQVECDESQCDDIISYIGTISSVLGAAPIKAKQACYLPRHMRFGQESGPLIGKTKTPGLYIASGHTCWGIQNGPATGKLMSEFIFDGDAQSADVSKLDPRKFKV